MDDTFDPNDMFFQAFKAGVEWVFPNADTDDISIWDAYQDWLHS